MERPAPSVPAWVSGAARTDTYVTIAIQHLPRGKYAIVLSGVSLPILISNGKIAAAKTQRASNCTENSSVNLPATTTRATNHRTGARRTDDLIRTLEEVLQRPAIVALPRMDNVGALGFLLCSRSAFTLH